MNKPLLLCVVLTLACLVAPKTITLGESGNQYFKLTYMATDPYDSSEVIRVKFEVKLDSILEDEKAATTICFKTADSSYTLVAGQDGFGISFTCTVDAGCNLATDLNVSLYGSTLSVVSPPTWATNGQDTSNMNRGSTETGSGTEFDTIYGMDSTYLGLSHLPAENEQVFLKCFTSFNADRNDALLNTNLELSDSTFIISEHTFTITEADLGSNGGGGNENESSAMELTRTKTLFASIVAIMMIAMMF